MRREPTFSTPAREIAPRKGSRSTTSLASRAFAFRFLPRTFGGYMATIFVTMLIGVAFNAIDLQHERHPAPLFAHEPPASPATGAEASAPEPARSNTAVTFETPQATKLDSAPTPAARPIDRAIVAAVSKKADPINDLLRKGGISDFVKDLTAAQRALVKLGYELQPDGVMSAETLRALHDFEKSHGIPISSEITPRLLARLNASPH